MHYFPVLQKICVLISLLGEHVGSGFTPLLYHCITHHYLQYTGISRL
jgi:hypothetical protein